MKMKSVNNKYQFTPRYGNSGVDYSELVTVPDQVLSMYDIYMKYAVRGDLTGLANNARPHVSDDFDLDDPELDVEYDDDVDVLARSRQLRNEVSVPANPAVEDIPVAEGVDKETKSPAKPEKPASDNAGSAGSE